MLRFSPIVRGACMPPAVVVIAPGAMGAAVAARLSGAGVAVYTLLAGRSAASIKRAKDAGMADAASEQELVERAELILSIVPPGEALALAERFRPALAAAAR